MDGWTRFIFKNKANADVAYLQEQKTKPSIEHDQILQSMWTR